MILLSPSSPADLVTVLVRGPIAAQVRVVESGEGPEGPYAVLACDTRLACEHAMLSVAAHSTTPLERWKHGWERQGNRFVLRVDGLRDEPYDN